MDVRDNEEDACPKNSEDIPDVAIIAFDDQINSFGDEYIVFEGDKEFIDNLTHSDTYIIGDSGENASIISGHRSYDVKSNETSNSILVMRPSLLGNSTKKENCHKIIGIVKSHLVYTPKRVPLNSLFQILSQYPYNGDENETIYESSAILTTDSLSRSLRCSHFELLELYGKINCIFIDEKPRIVSEFHFSKCILNIYYSILKSNQTVDNFCITTIINDLGSLFHPAVINYSLQYFVTANEISRTHRFNMDKFFRYVAVYILQPTQRMNITDFFDVLRNLLPGYEFNDTKFLSGVGILVDNILIYLNTNELSLDPESRFSVLFRHKSIWTRSEIMPYVDPLVDSTNTSDAILFSFCQASNNINGVPIFFAKQTDFSFN